MSEIVSRAPLSSYEHLRGIFGEVAIRAIKGSNLPGYFIGKPIVGAGKNPTIDYDSLRHICLAYYESYLRFFQEGLITVQDLEHRKSYVMGWLPKALFRNGGFLSQAELKDITLSLTTWFHGNPEFRRVCAPLLRALHFSWFRWCLRTGTRVYIAARDRSVAGLCSREMPRDRR